MKTFPKPLSHGEEKLYLKRCKEGDQTARNMLIEHNMRLVAHVVKKYQCQDYDTEDLLSAGTIGLIKAVNTFDTDKGSRLATYAARCVENEILMLLRAGKKRAREVSLFEPIGTDKDGEAVNLVDVIEMENPRTIDQLILDQDIRGINWMYMYTAITRIFWRRIRMPWEKCILLPQRHIKSTQK